MLRWFFQGACAALSVLLVTATVPAQFRPYNPAPESHGSFPRDWMRAPEPFPAASPEAEPAPAYDWLRKPLFEHTLAMTPPVRLSRDGLPAVVGSQAETQAEPHLHVNPENPLNLVATYQESRFNNGGARTLNVAVSFDGGQTWKESSLPKLTVASGGKWEKASDPWVAFGPNQRVYVASLIFNVSTPANALGVSISTDGGANWAAPVEVGNSTADFNDKEALTVDTNPNSPFFGTVYLSWDINLAQDNAQHLAVTRSTDGGRTWSKIKRVRKEGPSNIGVIPAVGPDGTAYLVWAGDQFGANVPLLFFSRSLDGGRKWSKPKSIAEARFQDIPNIRAGEFLPFLTVNPVTGELFVAWLDGRWTGTGQVTLIRSTDRGESWSAPLRISDGPNDSPCWAVSLAAMPNGTVGVSYLSLRNDPERKFLTDLIFQMLPPNGTQFEPGLRVTPESFDVRFAAQTNDFRNRYFPGDYMGLAGTTTGFHFVWVGTSENSMLNPTQKQPDVFVASVWF
ncbi:MAG: glycoside hydrolase [Blastocatellia bacterium]|nr:glycoside hydrolase [Blastocatellia bacterium]